MKPGLLVLGTCVFLISSSPPASAWNFAVWPGTEASQWAPSLGLTNVIGVAAGSDRTLFLRSDGSIVWSWGGSWTGSTNATKLSSYCHDVALLADSTVAEWGLASCAGSGPYTTMPPGLSNVVAIAAGDRHTLVLKADETCVSWGWMTVGTGQAYVPDGLSNVVAIAAGFDISGALKSDGSVVAWGYPSYGGTAAPGGLTDGRAIAMGHHHGLVLRSNGVVVAWGTTPPDGLTNVTRIAAQQTWSMVQKADGRLVAWNDGIGSQHNVPTQPLTNVIDLAAGSYHGVVLVGDGPPQPLWQLSNQVAIAGNAVTFTGEALGTEPLSYQWLLNGTNLTGAVSPTLTLTNLVPARAGTYAVVASNAFGVVTNSGGSLTVLPFAITSTPTNATLFGGDAFYNSVAADGYGLTYQWRHEGVDLPGQTNALLTISLLTTNDAGSYSVLVSNLFGASETAPVSLSVIPIQISYQPQDLSVYVGESATFWANVEKNGPFTFQWQREGTNLVGETNYSLTLNDATLEQTGVYRVLAGNPYGAVQSSNATLTVIDSAPILTRQPAETAIWPGGSAGFQVGATGSKPLFYQWRLGGSPVSGGTDSAFQIGSASTNDVGTYSVLVSNAAGTRLSGSAKLTLVPVVLWPESLLSGTLPLRPVLTNTVAVTAGNAFNAVIKSDGKVHAWGWNGEGETNVPPWLTNVSSVAAGSSHLVALQSNGTVVAWGANGSGQTNVPKTLSNVVGIAAGDEDSFAIKADGTVFGWGRFDYTRGITQAPGQDWSKITSMAAGQFHRVGLRADGSVVTWLDYSDYTLNKAPSGLTNVVAVGAAARHSLALKADGRVIAWGDASSGLTNIPADLTNVVAISCGQFHSVALKAEGTIVSWGGNAAGQTNVPGGLGVAGAISAGYMHTLALLGAADPAVVRAPRSVSGAPFNPVLLSVGAVSRLPLSYQWRFNGQDIPAATNAWYRIAALSPSDTGAYQVVISNELGTVTATARVDVSGVLAWGGNIYGQANVPPEIDATAVAGGIGHSLALRPNGTVAAWGRYATIITNVPASATNVLQISAGPSHSLALKSDGKVLSWGSIIIPVPANLSNVVAVADGNALSLALKADGSVSQWGPLGTQPPPGLSNVVGIASGYYFGVALKSDGTAVSWGVNAPAMPAGLSNVVAITAGNGMAAALRADHTIVTWPDSAPAAPPDLGNAVALAAGGGHFLALNADGTVVAWGTNNAGQTDIPGNWTKAAAIAAGDAHSLAVIDARDPLFVRQPLNTRAYSGNPVLISAGARSAQPLRFQWRFNGTNLPGATSDVLALQAVGLTNAGTYALTASNSLGVISCSNVTLTVLDQKPFLRSQPLSLAVSNTANALFSVLTDGSEPKFYQWRKNGNAIEGATNAVLALSGLRRTNEGQYSVTVSNAFGSIASSSAALRVMVPQRIQAPLLNPDGSIGLLSGDYDGGQIPAADLNHFEVISSTNLLDWEVLTNSLSLTNGLLWFSDDPPTNRPQRFYRLRELP